jgi:glycine dehydrogenase subunit 2
LRYSQAVYSHSQEVNEPLIIELGSGTEGVQEASDIPERMKRRGVPNLPCVPEITVVRHYTRLSQMNFGVDTGTYPLGSCTMKYNPKLNDELASLEGFSMLHPKQEESTAQGALELLWRLETFLKELTGMDAVTLEPAAGSQGELTGMLITKAYFRERGETGRRKVLIPDTAHGSNFASANMAGFEVVTIPSRNGELDPGIVSRYLGTDTAAFMITVPNTLGIFESNILTINRMVHDAGALAYFDGANMNALLGRVKPGDLGFDIAHLNTHKTFSTPHGGGGPGAGPVCVKKFLEVYLPVPRLRRKEDGSLYWQHHLPRSVGRMREGYGNFGVLLRAYAYMRRLGLEGLSQVSRDAVLISNYAAKRLSQRYLLPFPEKPRKHEFVVSAKGTGKRALEIAKGILEYGHAPTVYFPQIVEEALMVEFTETETKREIDEYTDALLELPGRDLSASPGSTSVSKLDEAGAARRPVLSWRELGVGSK